MEHVQIPTLQTPNEILLENPTEKGSFERFREFKGEPSEESFLNVLNLEQLGTVEQLPKDQSKTNAKAHKVIIQLTC